LNSGAATPTIVKARPFRVIVPADDAGVGAELPPPQAVADDGDRIAPDDLPFVRAEPSPELHSRPEDREVVPADGLAVDPHRLLARRGQRALGERVGREAVERSVRGVVLVLEPRELVVERRAAAARVDPDQLFGRIDRQRPPQQAVEHVEERRVAPIPSASERAATTVNIGLRPSWRTAVADVAVDGTHGASGNGSGLRAQGSGPQAASRRP